MTDKTRAFQGCYRRLEELGVDESNEHGSKAYEALAGLKVTLTVDEMSKVEQLLFLIAMSKIEPA